nr:low temperature requirement protein A [Actinomycetota bacterium]
PFNLVSAGLVLTGALLGGALRPILLVTALLLQIATPYFGVAPKFELMTKHFVERHGLLMIVALGETVIAVGLGVGPTNLDVLVLVTMLLAFSLPAALWWAYFSDDTDSAAAALDAKEPTARSMLAIRRFFYAYIPMLLGIVFLAAGIHEALAAPAARPSLAVALTPRRRGRDVSPGGRRVPSGPRNRTEPVPRHHRHPGAGKCSHWDGP